jgi:hypothetical protein
MSAVGRPWFGAPPPPGERVRFALAAAWLGAPARPATAWVDGVPYSLFDVPGQPAHRLARWFVGFTGDYRAWDADQRAIAEELTGVAARFRAQHEEGLRAERRSADEALRRVLERAGAGQDEEIAAALRRCGLAPCVPLVAVALTVGPAQAGADRPADLAELPQVARVLLEDMLSTPVTGVSGAEAVAIAPGGEDVMGRVRDAVSALGRVPQLELAAGVSVLADGGAGGPGGAGHAAGSYADGDAAGHAAGWTAAGIADAVGRARQARLLAALPGRGVRLMDAAAIGSVGLLLSLVPGEARRAFRARLLDPLLAYDREHGTELVRTLEVFLGCSGSWTKAAEAMFVHINSLRYRVRRIEELTGRDLGSLEDQAALLIALRIAKDPG